MSISVPSQLLSQCGFHHTRIAAKRLASLRFIEICLPLRRAEDPHPSCFVPPPCRKPAPAAMTITLRGR